MRERDRAPAHARCAAPPRALVRAGVSLGMRGVLTESSIDDVLTVVACHAQLLEDSFDAGDPRREDAAAIRRVTERGVGDAPRTLPAIRVLLVDDDAGVRAVTARILEEAGCTVTATTTADVRAMLAGEDFEVIVLEARGEALAAELRARPGPKLAIVTKPYGPALLRAAVARAYGTGERATVTATTDANPNRRRRALVADDDSDVRRVMVRLLERAEFDVVDVDSGFRAITALETEAFDVVVSDVQMPDGGGLDLLRSVRKVDLDVPVILVTGAPSLQAAATAVEYGAFRYLTKPIDNTLFLKTVQLAARAHALARLRREAFNVSGSHGGVADRAGLEVRFEQAVEGMWMAFQPIVHAASGALFGLEALLRSNEPSLPTPPALIDAAEQLGRLPVIGRRVRALSAAGIAQVEDVALFVNAHPQDLLDPELVDRDAPLTALASRVVIEVTERASLDPSPQLTARVAQLRSLGFRIAVDDIGAGYSGLTSFTELTPEIVKIDMSLVRDVHKSALKQRTIRALCRLCHEVGTRVVGEGVETPDERLTLVELGCDFLQGYLIGKPRRELP